MTLRSELTYSEVMEGRPRNPVYRGLA